jgi:hypothetical protein
MIMHRVLHIFAPHSPWHNLQQFKYSKKSTVYILLTGLCASCFCTLCRDHGWKHDHLRIHMATGGCDCSLKELLMMGTIVPKTCWVASMWLSNKCYDWLLHLVGCFIWMLLHCLPRLKMWMGEDWAWKYASCIYSKQNKVQWCLSSEH